MNEPQPNDPLDALFALARERRPDTSRAEFAFETRLLARLKAEREPGSVWAMVAWRMIPFFAVCMVGLVIWQSQLVSETTDAEQVAYVENPAALDSTTNVDL